MVDLTLENDGSIKNKVDCNRLFKITGLTKTEETKIPQSKESNDVEKANTISNIPADFETAIAATGYGWFHITLVFVTMPAYLSTVFVSTSISYTLAGAECDLGISLMDKGLLNSMTYVGMMVSAVVWGYLSDILGRKKIMVVGYASLAIIEIIGSLSQTFSMLLTAKFFAGFVANGPFAVLVTYIAEMHPTTIRAKVLIFTSLFFSLGTICLPAIAWAVMPYDWNFSLFGGTLVIHSWNIFLAICSIPSIITGCALYVLPESPKFLMSRGRNEEALRIFELMYFKNTGLKPETYPVKSLIEEIKPTDQHDVRKLTGLSAVTGGMKQMAPFLSAPYLAWSLLLFSLNIAALFSENSLRLWYPQIAGILDDYTVKHTESVSLCEIISNQTQNTIVKDFTELNDIEDCVKLTVGTSTYVSSIVVGSSTALLYLFSGFFVNRIGKKRLLVISYAMAALLPLALPWTSNMAEIVSVFAIYLSFTGCCTSTLSTVIVDLYPTQLRAMAMAAFMLFGRVGSILGNLIFPALLQTGCYPPFFAISGFVIACAIGCSFLPVTTLKNLE